MPSTVSDSGLDFIKQRENYSPAVYSDGDKTNRTIGWGHKLLDNESYPNGIDIESAEKVFRDDVGQAEGVVRRNVKVPLNQNQYDALVSYAYNRGAGRFANSDALTALNRGDYDRAAVSIHNMVGEPTPHLRGIALRRAAEAATFLKPPS